MRVGADLAKSDQNAIVPVAIGTAAWIVALVVLVVLGALGRDIEAWWIGMTAVGAISGGLGLVFLRRRPGRPQE